MTAGSAFSITGAGAAQVTLGGLWRTSSCLASKLHTAAHFLGMAVPRMGEWAQRAPTIDSEAAWLARLCRYHHATPNTLAQPTWLTQAGPDDTEQAKRLGQIANDNDDDNVFFVCPTLSVVAWWTV